MILSRREEKEKEKESSRLAVFFLGGFFFGRGWVGGTDGRTGEKKGGFMYVCMYVCIFTTTTAATYSHPSIHLIFLKNLHRDSRVSKVPRPALIQYSRACTIVILRRSVAYIYVCPS